MSDLEKIQVRAQLPVYSYQRFLKSLIDNALVSVVTRVTAAVYTLLAAAMLDQTDFGLLLIGLGILTLMGTLTSIGAPSALNYFTTLYHVENRVRDLRALIINSLAVVFIVSCFSGLVLFTASGWLAETVYDNTEAAGFIALTALALPAFSLSCVLTGVMRGLQRTAMASFVETTMFRLSQLLLLLVVVGFSLGAKSIMAGIVITSLFMLIWSFIVVWKSISGPIGVINWNMRLNFTKYAINSWITSLANTANSRADIVVLGLFVSVSEIPVFAVAATLSSLLLFSVNVLSPAFRPVATHLIASGETDEFISLYCKIVRFNILVMGPLTIYFGVFAEMFVEDMFDDSYSEAWILMLILILGILPRLIMGPANPTLLAMGGAGIVRQIDLSTAVVFVAPFCVLAYYYGLVGAAIALAFFGLCQHGFKNYFVRRYFDIPWFPETNALVFLVLVGSLGLFLRWISGHASLPESYTWLIMTIPFGAGSVGCATMTGVLTRITLETSLKKTLSLFRRGSRK